MTKSLFIHSYFTSTEFEKRANTPFHITVDIEVNESILKEWVSEIRHG